MFFSGDMGKNTVKKVVQCLETSDWNIPHVDYWVCGAGSTHSISHLLLLISSKYKENLVDSVPLNGNAKRLHNMYLIIIPSSAPFNGVAFE